MAAWNASLRPLRLRTNRPLPLRLDPLCPQAMLPAPELWAVPKTTVAQAVEALAVVRVEALAAQAQALASAAAAAPAPAPAPTDAAPAGEAAPAPAA